MKKAIALLCLFLFLIINSGIAVTIHWCGGKLSSIDFFSCGKHACRCGKKAMNPKCCKIKTVVLKEKTDSVNINQFKHNLEIQKITFSNTEHIDVTPSLVQSNSTPFYYHPPPDKSKVPIFLFDKVILI